MTTQSEDIKDRCSKILRAARAHPHGSTSNLAVNWGFDTVPHTPSQPRLVAETRRRRRVRFSDRRTNPFERAEDASLQFVLPPPSRYFAGADKAAKFLPGQPVPRVRDPGEHGHGACASRVARQRCLADIPCVCQSRSLTSLWIRVAHRCCILLPQRGSFASWRMAILVRWVYRTREIGVA